MTFSNKSEFYDLIEIVSSESSISPAIIEKDYYVTLFLRELTNNVPDIVFKGGTSLSKCYGIISRFSEDIDLNYGNGKNKPSESMRRKMKDGILQAAENLGLQLIDMDPKVIPYRRDYLVYHFSYPSLYKDGSLRDEIMVETSVRSPSYPIEVRRVNSLVHQYLSQHSLESVADEYGVIPFPIQVQTLDRAFADKLYAVADYYLENKPKRNSRHLYDIFRIMPQIKIDDQYGAFLRELRDLRRTQPNNPSANAEESLALLLQHVLDSDFYRKDYEQNTTQLLFEDVPYESVKDGLQHIVDELQCLENNL